MVFNTRLELKVPTVGKTVGLVEMNLASIAMPLVAVAVKVEPPVPMLLVVLDMFTTLEKVNVLLVGRSPRLLGCEPKRWCLREMLKTGSEEMFDLLPSLV